VVSDYDLLALDKLGSVKNDKQLFPAADETWQVRAAATCATAGALGRVHAATACAAAAVHFQ
jgi:hypothetical protein